MDEKAILRELRAVKQQMRRLHARLERQTEAVSIEQFIVTDEYIAGDKIMAKSTGATYKMGNVGKGARVAQGRDISWREGLSGLPGGDALARDFEALIAGLARDKSLDDDRRELAKAKTEAVAEGLAKVATEPGQLRRALIDARAWFSREAISVGRALAGILQSEPAQKALAVVTEAGTKAAIESFTGQG